MFIARALANRPLVILADEPTAPLDSERALAAMRILNQMASDYQTAIIVETDDENALSRANQSEGQTLTDPASCIASRFSRDIAKELDKPDTAPVTPRTQNPGKP